MSLLVAIVLGLPTALAKLSVNPVARTISGTYTTIIRGIPDLVIMFLIFYGSQIGINTLGDWLGWEYIDVPPFTAGVLIIGFVFGTYMAETFRGAILAVQKGQLEAAEAFGLTQAQVLFHVLVPQMLRHALPSFTNNWLVLMKGTALVSLIGLEDVVRKGALAAGATRAPFPFYLAVAFIFLAFTSVSLLILQRLERREIKPFHRTAAAIDGVLAIPGAARALAVSWFAARGFGLVAGAVVIGGIVYYLLFAFDYAIIASEITLSFKAAPNNVLGFTIDKIGYYVLGLCNTVVLVGISLVLGLAISIILAVGRTSTNPLINGPIWAYTYFFRGTPLLVQLYLFYYGFGLYLGQMDLARDTWLWEVLRTAWYYALLVFILNTVAYTTEIIRSAIERTPIGEIEAARAVGLNRFRQYSRIILPSALYRSIPAYGNEIIFMLHGSAVAGVITVVDLFGAGRNVYSDHYAPFEAFAGAGTFYLVLTFGIVFFVRWLEKRFLRHLVRESKGEKAKTSGMGMAPTPAV